MLKSKYLRVGFLCLIILMTLFLGSFSAYANEMIEGYYKYTVTDGKAQITGYSKYGPKDVEIPSELGGYPVWSIKGGFTGVFSGYSINSVAFPTTLRRIGENTFRYNNLTSANIPNNVLDIGARAFYQNQLASITIPNRVTRIAAYTFSENKLTSVIIPDSVTRIGEFAFRHNNLTSVIVPGSVTYIDRGVFNNNVANPADLTIYGVPNSVAHVYAFDHGYTFKELGNQTLTIGIQGHGTTVPKPGEHNYDQGHTVTLSATPAEGWAFDRWVINSLVVTDPATQIVMDADIKATAYFIDPDTEDAFPPELDNMMIIGGIGVSIDLLFDNNELAREKINAALDVDGVSFADIVVNFTRSDQLFWLIGRQAPTAGEISSIMDKITGYWDADGNWVA